LAGDADSVRESVLQNILMTQTAKSIYAAKALFTFSSINGADNATRSSYIKNVISVDKALSAAGVYGGLVLSDSDKQALINDIVSGGKYSTDVEGLSGTVIDNATAAITAGTGANPELTSLRGIIRSALGL
jgi:hypothetical protein